MLSITKQIPAMPLMYAGDQAHARQQAHLYIQVCTLKLKAKNT